MVECHVPFTDNFNLTSDLVFRIIVSRAYLILLKVGIPNLVCGCILEWQSVTYHYLVTVTLTSYLIFRITCVRNISLILFEMRIPNLVCGCILGWRSVGYHLQVTVT